MISIPSVGYLNPVFPQTDCCPLTVYNEALNASNYSVINPMSSVGTSGYFLYKFIDSQSIQQPHSIFASEFISPQMGQELSDESLNSYWMCVEASWDSARVSQCKSLEKDSPDNDVNVEKLIHYDNDRLTKAPAKSKRLLLEQRIDGKIPKIFESLYLINSEDSVLIHGKQKLAPRGNSNRRSTFIGVFKNGPNWQALISIDKKKTYIGTYSTELDAAKAFDYYSILLHGLTAVTNFDYSKRSIVELIAENQAD